MSESKTRIRVVQRGNDLPNNNYGYTLTITTHGNPVAPLTPAEARTLARDLLAAVGEPMPDPVIEWGVRWHGKFVTDVGSEEKDARQVAETYSDEAAVAVHRTAIYGEWVEADEPRDSEADRG